jgi:eukaryotic-like serine/threonine-protein kinase
LHPAVGGALNNLATIYVDQGRFADARARYERTLAAFEATLGPDDMNVAQALVNIAATFLEEGRHADARRRLERAAELIEQFDASDYRYVGVLINLAAVERAAGHPDEARRLDERALDRLGAWQQPGHPFIYPLTGLARSLVDLGQAARAIEFGERAVAIGEASPGDPMLLARARFALARALRAAGRDPARAAGVADQARVAMESLGARAARDLAELDAWRGGR